MISHHSPSTLKNIISHCHTFLHHAVHVLGSIISSTGARNGPFLAHFAHLLNTFAEGPEETYKGNVIGLRERFEGERIARGRVDNRKMGEKRVDAAEEGMGWSDCGIAGLLLRNLRKVGLDQLET